MNSKNGHHLAQRILPDSQDEAVPSRQSVYSLFEEKILQLLPYPTALKIQAFPINKLSVEGVDVISCVTSRKDLVELKKELKFLFDKEALCISLEKEEFQKALFNAYKGQTHALTQAMEALPSPSAPPSPQRSRPVVLHDSSDSVAKFVDSLIEYGVAQECSDIHLSPSPQGGKMAMRKTGKLHEDERPFCTPPIYDRIVGRIKALALLDATVKTRPQDGSFVVDTPSEKVNVRCAIIPLLHGEGITLRFLARGKPVLFEQLGFCPAATALLQGFIDNPVGTVICSGPTGSGKTTTLASLLLQFQGRGFHLMSVEDPIEYHLPTVSQIQVNPRQGLTFDEALRGILRHDPDIIMVGEIRDYSSGSTALQAALTGHAVLTSVHAQTAPAIIHRLQSLGLTPELLAESVSFLISQRLFPRLCSGCREIDEVSTRERGVPLFIAPGCSLCQGSGSEGVILAAEVIQVESTLREQILLRRPLNPPSSHRVSMATSLEYLLRGGLIGVPSYGKNTR